MRALQYAAHNAPIRLVETASPTCPVDGAVIDVRATGVCRSDWHAWRGHEEVPLPQVPGHEFAGVVAAVGAEVSGFRVGERVTAPFVNGCGRCPWCRAGSAQVCPDQSQPGFTHPGSFADRVVVRNADFNLVRLPEQVDFVTAAALGCRFATAYHALTAQAELGVGESVVVFGCGGVGLSTVMIATALGARVVAVDPSPANLALAAELGAAELIGGGDAAGQAEPASLVRELTDGGAHVSVDAVGSASTLNAAVRSLRRRGRHLQIGLLGGDPEAGLPWDLVVGQELRVLGSHGMAAVEYPGMLAMISDGRLRPELMVGAVIELEAAGDALMEMDRPVAGRAGIVVATP